MRESEGIYIDHFGLHRRPFTMLPEPDFIYWTEAHSKAMAALEYGAIAKFPVLVLSGEIGSGKTTLVAELCRRVPRNSNIGLVTSISDEPENILKWALAAFGQKFDSGTDSVQLFQQFRLFLARETRDGNGNILIIDEAQNLSDDSLEAFRLLSNINAEDAELLQIVLVGQPAFMTRLQSPEQAKLAQRVGAEYHLPLLTRAETDGYVLHRMETAGARRRVFSHAASELIHNTSGGVPRLINKICDYSLVYSYSMDRKTVDSAIVDQVVKSQKIFTQSWPSNVVTARFPGRL